MNNLTFAQEDRAGLLGMAAYGEHHVQFDILEFVDVLGFVTENVNSSFGHHFYGVRAEPVRLNSGRVSFDDISLEVSSPAFGYLTATRIPRAQKQHIQFLTHDLYPDLLKLIFSDNIHLRVVFCKDPLVHTT